jgi:hypothetical protein
MIADNHISAAYFPFASPSDNAQRLIYMWIYIPSTLRPSVELLQQNIACVIAEALEQFTSEDIHLYLDVVTTKSETDCEGLPGGERKPVRAKLRCSPQNSDLLEPIPGPVSERALAWACISSVRSRASVPSSALHVVWCYRKCAQKS